MNMDNGRWQQIEANEYGQQWMTTNGGLWIWMTQDNSKWRLMNMDDCIWQQKEGNEYGWL